jgi:thioesterase domain-containing protein
MTIRFVTTNPGKVREAREYLAEPVEQLDFDTPEIQSADLGAIAAHKARAAYEHAGEPVFVDDAGLFIEAFDGFPGPYSSYVHDTVGVERVWRLASEEDDRAASFRGVVAYELACQLQAAGHQVAFLALLESFNPRWHPRHLKWNARTLFHAGLSSPFWMMEFVRNPGKYWGRLRRKGGRVFAPPEIDYANEGGRSELSGYWKLHKERVEIHERALKQYVPKPYQGRLHLFRSRRTLALTHLDPDLGWGSLATHGVKVHWVRGHHGTILYEPYVPYLARIFKPCLQSLPARAL